MLFTKNTEPSPYIKNVARKLPRRDFGVNAIGVASFCVLAAAAVVANAVIEPTIRLADMAALLALPVAAIVLMTMFPRWIFALKILLLAAAALVWFKGGSSAIFLALAVSGIVVAPAIQKLKEWERAIVLRFGVFHRVKGPGLFFLIPFVDQVATVVDLRIRVTDFRAETTLTRDSVTVTVDALCFWLVWDAEKAICEVQDYEEAVVLSSQTALRNAVSKTDLTTFLERGDDIEEQIRAEVDKKTTEWGITVQHIEITDIQIPECLQDSLSRLAQAEREKKARILLAEAEIEIAHRLEEAARVYRSDDIAMRLKNLSILNEGLKAGNSMMLVPDSITEELRSRDIFGLQALNETRKTREKRDEAREGGTP